MYCVVELSGRERKSTDNINKIMCVCYLPRLTETADSSSIQAHYNGKETVEVPLCFAAAK